MKYIYTAIASIILGALIMYFIKQPEEVIKDRHTVTYDTVEVKTTVKDTSEYAQLIKTIDSLGNVKQQIKVVREPYKVLKLDTHFVFNELKTYKDSIYDTNYKFIYEADVLGELMNLRSDFTYKTQTITKNISKNYHNLSLNCLFGSSVLIHADYSSYKKPFLLYGAAIDPVRKKYFVSFGYRFRF